MTELTIVPAGAGAGKTHHIKEKLAEWVRERVVRPDRILAVTFTEAAAAELRQRIRTALLADGDIEAALAVERAYVSTIHGLGRRLLVEHALACGQSPELRLIEEGEQDLLIRRCIDEEPSFGPLAAELAAQGVRQDFTSGKSAEDGFRKLLLRLVNQLRSLGTRGDDPALVELARASIREAYGEPQGDDATASAALLQAVTNMLEAFPAPIDDPDYSNAARTDFRDNHRTLVQARRQLARGERDWPTWQKLRKLRLSGKGGRKPITPEGYDALAAAVMSSADALTHLPGPLEDALRHSGLLVGGAQKVMAAYAERKRELGVIDYADMVANAAAMLARDPAVLSAILAEVDCVIIDEFQDTSPIQFAFLWSLASKAPRTLIVGDTKQAVMGFQGADPRLTASLAGKFPTAPLPKNWRSDPRIMDFINALGPRLFGEDYLSLAPARKPGSGPAMEVIQLKKSHPHHVAERIHALLHEERVAVRDRESEALRPVEPRDVAVLCLTHKHCAKYAEALRTLGLPVRLAESDWWASPVVQAAAFALRLAADPRDRHAALCVATLGPMALPLDEALRLLARGEELAAPELDALASLHAAGCAMTIERLLGEVLRITGLRAWCDRLDNPAQMRADLLRLEAEARAFTRAERATREAAAFYGEGVQVFLGWIEARAKNDDKRPPASGHESDGVEVVTWHSAKGREWPIVVVCDLGHARDPKAPEFSAPIPDFDDFDRVLDGAGLVHVPVFAASESQSRCLEPLRPEAEEECRRLLYVALTRARERLVIEWPPPPSKSAKQDPDKVPPITPLRILVEQCGVTIGAEGIEIGGETFPARQIICDKDEPPIFPEHHVPPDSATRVPRHAIVAARGPASNEVVTGPSAATRTAHPLPPLATQPLAPGVRLEGGSVLARATDRGTAIHAAFRILLLRPDLRHRVAAHCRIADDEAAALAGQAEALRSALAQHGYPRLHVEQPLEVLLADGNRQLAIVDLLAEGEAGFLVIDHKSGAVTNHAARFAEYWPQLAAYAEAVTAASGLPVTGTGVFWTDTGELTLGTLAC